MFSKYYCIENDFFLSTAAVTIAAATLTIATVGTFTTGSTLTIAAGSTGTLVLGIAFGLGQQGFAAEFEFAVLLVYGDNLNSHNIAFVEDAFEGFGAIPVVFADVHEAFFAGEELEECTEFDYADNFCVVNLTHFGDGAYFLDPFKSGVDRLFVDSGDINHTHFAFLFDIDDGVGLFLYFLDNLATLAESSSDEVLGTLDLDNAGD